jgi:hypothetical protein
VHVGDFEIAIGQLDNYVYSWVLALLCINMYLWVSVNEVTLAHV